MFSFLFGLFSKETQMAFTLTTLAIENQTDKVESENCNLLHYPIYK